MNFSITFSKTQLDKFNNLLLTNKLNAQEFILKNSNLSFEERRWLATQIKCRSKAKIKHPDFFLNNCFYLEKSIEQSTSYWVARVKALQINTVNIYKVCDLTGGMGAETIAFAKNDALVHYVEPDEELYQISNYNFSKFKTKKEIITHHSNAERFLKQNTIKFDLILLDPDRRSEGKRDFSLENSSPNPIILENEILNHTSNIWIKHSPLIDLSYLKAKFKFIKTIFVISYRNEVKEVSTLHSRDNTLNPHLVCISINSKGDYTKVEFENKDNNFGIKTSENCKKYFYEPDKAIIKSGFADVYGLDKNLLSLSKGIPYYTSDVLTPDFTGRVFELKEEFSFSQSHLKTFLNKNKTRKFSIGTRGFPIKAEEIERKFSLKPDDINHLFFFINNNGIKTVIWCKSYLPNSSI